MRIRRVARLAPLALLLVPAVWTPIRSAAAGGGGAEALTIATEFVPFASPTKPGDLPRAEQTAAPIPLTGTVPRCLKTPASGSGRILYGEMTVGSKRAGLAVIRDAGSGVVLDVDANLDGLFAGPGETAAGTLAAASPLTRLEWRTDAFHMGDVALDVSVAESPALLAGWIEFPSRDDQKPIPPVRLDFRDLSGASTGQAGTVLQAQGMVDGRDVVVGAERGAGDLLIVAIDPEGKGAPGVPTARFDLKSVSGGASESRGAKDQGPRWEVLTGLKIYGHPAVLRISEVPLTTSVSVNVTGSRRGRATVGGAPYVLLLVDGDFDGAYASEDDFWWFGPVDWFGVQHKPRWSTMFEATEPMRGWGAWRLQSVARDGTAIVAPAEEPSDPEAYLRRREDRVTVKRWLSKFEEEARSLSGGKSRRPTAAAPPNWHYATDLDAARAMAAKEQKPLLVDFEADWCKPCHRLDHFVYNDREVQEWLSRFTAVKFNVELDPKETLWKFTGLDGKPWGGLPAIAVFKAWGGAPVHFWIAGPAGPDAAKVEVDHMSRILEPQELVAGLKAAYTAASTDK